MGWGEVTHPHLDSDLREVVYLLSAQVLHVKLPVLCFLTGAILGSLMMAHLSSQAELMV